MRSTLSVTELEKTAPSEVERDLKIKRAEAANMRLGLEMGKEKDHAGYRVLKGDIARMTMVLHRLRAQKPQQKTVQNTEKTASKIEKNPVKDAGSAKVVTAKSPSRTKKAK